MVILLDWGDLRRLAAAVLLGAFLGASAAMLTAADQIDSLLSVNQRQKNQLEDLQGRLEAMEKSLETRRQPSVQRLSVESNIRTERLQLRVEKYIKDLLSGMMGKPLSKVDPLMTYKVLDGRTAVLDKQEYTFKVRALLIAEDALVILDVIPGRTDVEE